MAKQPTKAELEATIKRLQPYETLASLRHCEPGKVIRRQEDIDGHGGRYRVTVSYYGKWRSDGGIVEIIAQPLGGSFDQYPTGMPIVEVYSYDDVSEGTAAFRLNNEGATWTAPWTWLARWIITDGVRVYNESQIPF